MAGHAESVDGAGGGEGSVPVAADIKGGHAAADCAAANFKYGDHCIVNRDGIYGAGCARNHAKAVINVYAKTGRKRVHTGTGDQFAKLDRRGMKDRPALQHGQPVNQVGQQRIVNTVDINTATADKETLEVAVGVQIVEEITGGEDHAEDNAWLKELDTKLSLLYKHGSWFAIRGTSTANDRGP